MTLNSTIAQVTDRLRNRSKNSRGLYLERIRAAHDSRPARTNLGCSNLAHGFAACEPGEKADLAADKKANIAIVSAYNDMLSAHQPYETYPALIKKSVREAGAVAQFAGGVPAMCDGVTQGRPGMDLSLFSRDVIAMSTAVALSHDMFDGALLMGICDKIVPGLTIAALSFGHLPMIFVPAGPMPSGLPNSEKARIRQLYAEGKVGRKELLEAESAAYHSAGTCTFYGTANSNQMLMEIMGLHMPGATFINPNTPLRDAMTKLAAKRIVEINSTGNQYLPVGEMIDERSVINGVVGLLATGGSTNHTMHLVAMARAGGIQLQWDDFAALSDVVPLIAKVYPNGQSDVNHFHAAGGMAYLIGELVASGLLHEDVQTVNGTGLSGYVVEAKLKGGEVVYEDGPRESLDPAILSTVKAPFSPDGGLKMLSGNLGKGVVKTSAVKEQHRIVEAPARVFTSQEALTEAFKAGELHRDFVAVVTFQGPKSIGMPELHKLTPPLGVLQDLGYKVALVTDGRMSGASGKVPSAIHMSPECADGGPLAKVRDGDIIRLDCEKGTIEVKLDAAELAAREPANPDMSRHHFGIGRDLFTSFRASVSAAEDGASVFTMAE